MLTWGAADGFAITPYEYRHRLMKAIAAVTPPGPRRAASLMRRQLDYTFLMQLLAVVEEGLSPCAPGASGPVGRAVPGYLSLLGDGAESARLPARRVEAMWEMPCLGGGSWAPFAYSHFEGACDAPEGIAVTMPQLSAAAAGGPMIIDAKYFKTVHFARITEDGRASTDGPLHIGDVVRPCAAWAADLAPSAAPCAAPDCTTVPLLRIAAIIKATSADGAVHGLCVGHEYAHTPSPMRAELSAAALAFAPWVFREVSDALRVLPLAAIYDKRHIITTRMAPSHATFNGRVLFTLKANGY
jgi:hypothetical protein